MSVRRGLIVGAGIGGLVLAHALRRRGWGVEVVERAARWEPVGAGIGLWSNALAVLDRLGLRTPVVARGVGFASGAVSDARGRVLVRVDYDGVAPPPVCVALHRAALHQALRGGIDDAVRLDASVTAIAAAGDRARVTFTDGASGGYDLVVGADGLRSRVRALLWNGAAPRRAGYTSWRWVLPFASDVEGALEMWGAGARIGLVPLRDGLLYGYATLNAARPLDDPLDGRLARFRERFAAFDGPARGVIEALSDDADLLHTDIEEVRLRGWTRGPVALIGDAAHAMTPNVAQGAAMAIEDAWVLARCASEARAVPEGLVRYERERRPRVEQVQGLSRRLGRTGQLGPRWACAVRDALVGAMPTSWTRDLMRPILTGAPA